MPDTTYLIPGGVVDVEHLGARCESRCHRIELRIAQLQKARARLERSLRERHERLAAERRAG